MNNASVSDWLCSFVVRHRKRYAPFDFPEPGSEDEVLFLEVWSRQFDKHGVIESEADEASISLGATPPRYRSEHLPAILKAVAAAREERASRFRVYHSPLPEPSKDPIIWPEGVRVGDYRKLLRRLSADLDQQAKRAAR